MNKLVNMPTSLMNHKMRLMQLSMLSPNRKSYIPSQTAPGQLPPSINIWLSHLGMHLIIHIKQSLLSRSQAD